jgi:hypothetical protein
MLSAHSTSLSATPASSFEARLAATAWKTLIG